MRQPEGTYPLGFASSRLRRKVKIFCCTCGSSSRRNRDCLKASCCSAFLISSSVLVWSSTPHLLPSAYCWANVIEGETVEESFRPFLRQMWVRASRGSRRQHFRCLTINFGDIHRIL